MTEVGAAREKDFLQALAPGFEADGFSFFLYPNREILPAFMHSYRPDAIAIKDDKKIAIEVKRETGDVPPAGEQLRSLFAGHPEWELRLYYIPGRPGEDDLEASDVPEIDAALAEVDQLKRTGHLRAALMMAWAALEAASRTILPHDLARPQTANRLIEVLASEGLVTPTEADTLREAIKLRNAATHGNFSMPVTEDKVDQVIAAAALIKNLSRELHPS